MWLSVENFKERYPIENHIASGSYGDVYGSKDSVVKIQGCPDGSHLPKKLTESKYPPLMDDHCLKAFLSEVNFGSYVSHPNIVPLLNYSYNEKTKTGYLAYKRGESIAKALRAKKITIEEIIKNLSVALSYLHVMGIAHCDLKPSNVVYYEGRAAIIDFGISQMAKMQTDSKGFTDLVIMGVAFSVGFCDPSYRENSYNSIRTEQFSLAKTIYTLYTGDYDIGKENQPKTLYRFRTGKLSVDRFIEDCLAPLSRRLSMPQICKRWKFDISECNYYSLPPLIVEVEKENISIAKSVFNQCIAVLFQKKVSARAAFLGAQLFRLFLPFIKDTEDNLESGYLLYCSACCYIGELFSCYTECASHKEWLELVDQTFSKSDFYQAIINILVHFGGILTIDTPWDFAKSSADLSTHLEDIFLVNYDPEYIRKMTDKIRFKDCNFRTITNTVPTFNSQFEKCIDIIPSLSYDIDPNIIVEQLEMMAERENLKSRDVIYLLHFEKFLNHISPELASKLYKMVLKHHHASDLLSRLDLNKRSDIDDFKIDNGPVTPKSIFQKDIESSTIFLKEESGSLMMTYESTDPLFTSTPLSV